MRVSYKGITLALQANDGISEFPARSILSVKIETREEGAVKLVLPVKNNLREVR